MREEKQMLPFSDEDRLGVTGERIVADRYLLKDVKKETLKVGSLVVAVLDQKRAYHELARVVELDEGNRTVTVQLRDGYEKELSFDHVDVLEEVAPRQMWRRIARAVARATKSPEVYEQKFYELQSQWRYVPGGRINASMGTGIQTTSYNCFVIPNVGPTVRDYARSFGQTLEIQARSGGVGMNLSQVPPEGWLTPVEDRSRKSDLLLVLDVWHEDLMEFLAQEYPNSTKVVRVSPAFLRAVENGEMWTYVFPDTTAPEYDEVWQGDLEAWMEADLPIRYGATLKAQVIYEKIVESGAQMLQDLVGTVMNPGDSRETIATTLADMWEAMLAHKRVTMVLSSLRPRYSYVRGVNGRSSGAYSWGQLYDKGNQVFGQGFGPVGVGEIMSVGCQLTLQGGSRRGALMLILNDRHADILKFIRCKQVDGVITGANISVGISEEFMQAKAEDREWTLAYPPIERSTEFDGDFFHWENQGKPLVVTAEIKASQLWDELIRSAWQSAEPGVVFLGRYNTMSNSYYFNPIIATNPCGEQGLPAFGICNLGAVVLSQFAVGYADSTAKVEFQDPSKEEYIRSWLRKYFDSERTEFLLHHVKWEELEEITRTGLRFQDAVIDATYYPFEDNRRNQLSERRVGLGIMGLHDLLIYCGIRYGSEESVHFIDVLLGMMAEWCYLESVELAKENGPFPMYDAEKFLQSGYMRTMAEHRPHVVEAIRKHGVRNVTTMTIAPTGTTGTMVGCSTGCEPYYAWSYYRNSRLGMFEERAEIVEAYRATHGEESPLPDYFVTSMELSPEEHVRVQAALQTWIDSSISKTCNAPNSYTVEDTKQLYDLAYELGCKGITIYRDGSRSEQVLSLTDPSTTQEGHTDQEAYSTAHQVAAATGESEWAKNAGVQERGYQKRKRPDVLYGATYKKETPLGTAFITINDDENHLAREIFVNIGKAGSDVYAANEALGRAITLYLMDSQNPDKEAVLVKHFSGIGGQSAVGFGERRITSVPDAIAKSLIEHAETFPLRQASQVEISATYTSSNESKEGIGAFTHLSLREAESGRDWCPECHQHTLIRHGGCYECEACGYSKC
ncbi:adenosylcobalamin-dependent ribonucleoside-diphosphate reductase [Sulfoacidibacillus thermotolerans]|uniref:Vitamin B12-dependent ribonucleotide reductase n=1 Tax=Sulfoacidibacillus thermotolerans TaxID=1765684 RepID=A0A2U3DCC3_SULT2|nr:adenosylcobalamin-dependent ribonucleoside-diphosphate reductase [Sulfoacidibacillus thermotolerans]PWI58912.1 ribonucleoside-diphosphate reductase, adenosylcobalamin-dependent [Sulfoacidibacillus thermotolerans]